MWRAIISSSLVGIVSAVTRLAGGADARSAGRIRGRVQLDAEPRGGVADLRADLGGVLANSRREHDRIQTTQRAGKGTQFAPDAIDKEIDGKFRARLGTRQKRSHVAGDPRNAEQAGLLVQQPFDRACIHAAFVHQVEHNARIEVAGAGAHRQAVDRGESHRGGNAAAALQRAHAGAVAEVQHDGAALRGLRVELRQHRGDVLVAQPVEAVAPHARLVQLVGQREHLGDLGIGAMKRRVEARDLRYVGRAMQYCANRREVMRLVQRRQRHEPVKRREHRCVGPHWLRVLHAAVHDPVADPDQLHSIGTPAQELEQVIKRANVSELRSIGP